MRHIFSCGGGVQSTACLVLAAQGKIPYRTFIFANVGDKAESPHTIDYINFVLKPYAKKHGIEWIDTGWVDKTGKKRDLYEDFCRKPGNVRLPMHRKGGGPGMRGCTTNYKIKPIAKWIKNNAPGCTLGLGISTDEPHRARPARTDDVHAVNHYPLIELGIDRSMCLRIVEAEGLPQPPKSSCWFCPYKTTEQWTTLKRSDPSLFEKACEMEDLFNEYATRSGHDPWFMSGRGSKNAVKLRHAIPDQLGLFPEWLDEQDGCESGYCMT